MGTIKTTNIETITGSGTLTLGQSGETISVPSGATLDLSNATQTGVGGVNTPAFEAVRTGTQSIGNASAIKIQFQTEIFDTDSAYDNSTNYRFTPQVAGKYFCFGQIMMNYGGSDFNDLQVRIHFNGTNTLHTRNRFTYYNSLYTAGILEFNGSTDYIECFIYQNSGGSINLDGAGSGDYKTRFGAYKLIGV